jgi:hypothetical protein
MQCPSASCHFIPLLFKYSLKNLVLDHGKYVYVCPLGGQAEIHTRMKERVKVLFCISFCLVKISEGKRLLGRPRHRRENSIKPVLKEIGSDFVDCSHLAQDSRTLVKMVMNV